MNIPMDIAFLVPEHLDPYLVAVFRYTPNGREVRETRPGALTDALNGYDAGRCELMQGVLREGGMRTDWHAQYAFPLRVPAERLPGQLFANRFGSYGAIVPRRPVAA